MTVPQVAHAPTARAGSGPAPGRTHIAFLDGIRAMAVLAVLVRHAWGLSGSPAVPAFGTDLRPLVVMLSCGVDLFFVLSGFLLAQSFFKRRQTGQSQVRWSTYARARLFRIGPPYWVILILVLLFMTPTFIPPERVFSGEGLAIFVAHAAILQTSFISSFGAYSVETPFWTLTIEVIFYALLPLLVRGFYGKRWAFTIPVMTAIAVGWLVAVRTGADWLVSLTNGPLNVFAPFPEAAVRFFLSHQFPAFLVDFALGITVALVVTSKRHALEHHERFQRWTSPAAGAAMFVTGSAVVIAAMWVLGTFSIRNGYADPLNYMTSDRPADLVYYYMETIPFGVGFSLLLAGACLGPAWLRKAFSFRPLALVGLIGYSVYLIHMPVLRVFNTYPWLLTEGDPSTHFIKLFLSAGTAIFALSALFYLTVERPSMAWSRAAAVRDLRPLRSVERSSAGTGHAPPVDDSRAGSSDTTENDLSPADDPIPATVAASSAD